MHTCDQFAHRIAPKQAKSHLDDLESTDRPPRRSGLVADLKITNNRESTVLMSLA